MDLAGTLKTGIQTHKSGRHTKDRYTDSQIDLDLDSERVRTIVIHCIDLAGTLLGDSGGVINSLDFCPASFKSLGCFYFWCVPSSQWKALTVNL